MTDTIENEGLDELDFDISKVDVNPTGVVPKTELDPEPEEAPEAQPEPKRGRPKKVEKPVEPEPEPEPETELDEEEPKATSNLFSTLAETLELDLEEEFEETEEGLSAFVQSAADKLADKKLNGWLESLPEVGSNFFDYLQMLGPDAKEEDIQKFFSSVKPEIDYKSIDLTNEDAQKAVMRTFYKKMDYDDNEVKDAIEDLEIAGTLEKSSKVASTKLAASQEKERAALIEKTKAEDTVKRQKIQEYWNTIDSTIKGGRVHSFNIPVAEQKAMLEYMSRPTKAGVPQLQEDLNNMNVEDRIALAIAVKNKFNLGKYITAAVKTQSAQTLKERLASGQTRLKNGNVPKSGLSDDILFDIK
jgi:hypothetical protein